MSSVGSNSSAPLSGEATATLRSRPPDDGGAAVLGGSWTRPWPPASPPVSGSSSSPPQPANRAPARARAISMRRTCCSCQLRLPVNTFSSPRTIRIRSYSPIRAAVVSTTYAFPSRVGPERARAGAPARAARTAPRRPPCRRAAGRRPRGGPPCRRRWARSAARAVTPPVAVEHEVVAGASSPPPVVPMTLVASAVAPAPIATPASAVAASAPSAAGGAGARPADARGRLAATRSRIRSSSAPAEAGISSPSARAISAGSGSQARELGRAVRAGREMGLDGGGLGRLERAERVGAEIGADVLARRSCRHHPHLLQHEPQRAQRVPGAALHRAHGQSRLLCDLTH